MFEQVGDVLQGEEEAALGHVLQLKHGVSVIQ
jgi:hypothetical protein